MEMKWKWRYIQKSEKNFDSDGQFWICRHFNCQLRAVLACVESNSTQADTVRSQIFREYLRENEFLSKTILAYLSGAQMASIHEIKKWQKIL